MRWLKTLPLGLAMLALLSRRLLGPVVTYRPIVADRSLIARWALVTTGLAVFAHMHRLAIVAHLTIAVAATLILIAVSKATLIPPEGTIVAVVAIVAMLGAVFAIVIAAVAIEAIDVGLPLRLEMRLRLGILETFVQNVVVLFLLRILRAALARLLPRVTVRSLAMLGRELLAVGHDDAVVVLRVLQIIFRQYVVAGGLSVPRKRHILLGYMRRRAANFYIGPVGFETARKRILVLAVIVIIIVVVASAPAAILLSLPHCVKGSRN